MGLIWIGLAVAAVVSLAVAMTRLVSSRYFDDVDVGSVSEGWLSHWARKDV